MKQKNLHVQHFGVDNYTRINSSFTYDAYDKDRFVRRLAIGSENAYFTPLDQMSKYLPQAVLQAEDPGFMQHRGFYLDAFRESIAKNFKERRFARGGSTISMQLVKNVFLSRDKTVSRKAEEALIVYLIENLGLVSKERMLEVYLNVIEWGPNVYGIGEASRFYFNKKPSELTLQESLFLSSIIPRPKSFQYQFDKEGQLRTSMGDYFKILTTRMVWRGVLEPADTIGLQPKVTLKGQALHVVMPKDTMTDETDNTE
jgi:membrane peptidoglycan carboxypeptidase